ncbi:phage tail protein [Lactiplantibacillus pentosus]|uniref:phage tail protein n=1 Tax=Lactiplantibacillus pentosus TaxID=1589 RepID=UPI001CDAD174|nr:phage tail protein [Lactiplantibacillus pentosus]
MAESNATQVILTDDGIKIIKAQDTADNAAGGVANLNDPNLMSVIEKQTEASQYAGLTSQYNVILKRAKDASISTAALTTAYTKLNAFMAAILTNTTKASDVDRGTYKSLTDAYNTALSTVQTALSDSFNTDMDNMQSSVSVASQAASSAVIVASQATTTGNNASRVASQAAVVANQAQSAGSNATNVANKASQAASSAILAGSTATVNADKAIATASQAQTAVDSAASVANKASKDASNAIFTGSQAASSAKSALETAQNTAKKYESLGMYKAWANTSPENQNINSWILSGPAKKAASITYAKGVNTIDYTGVSDYEVFSMPVHAKVGNKVSVTFAYTQPSVVSLDGSSNGVPVSFSDHPSEHTEIGANPLYLGVNAQSSKVYTISTTATSKTMYLSFNFGYLRDGINWKFELSAQQDMTTNQPALLSEYIGFSTKQSDNPADYTWLRNPDELEGEVQNQITIASNNAESKMVQTINSVGVGFKNPNGTTYTMYLTSDGTALLDFNKIMLNGQTNIQSSTIGTAQIANAAITNAQIGSLAVGTAQIKDEAVNSAKIANLAVGTAQIGDGAITNAKIGKLAVGTAQIANAAITDAQVGNVSANKLTAGTIDFNTITGKNINASNITTGTLSTDRLNVGKLSALSANLGDVTTGSLKGVDIIANTFSTPNGSFTTDAKGSVVASNLTIRGVTNLVYNAALLGGSGSNIPGWTINGEAYYSDVVLFDGLPAITWNGDATGRWDNYATSKLQPVTQTGIPYSASVKFRDYGSASGMKYVFSIGFFGDNGVGDRVGFVDHVYTANGSGSGIQTFTINGAIAPSNAKYVAVYINAYNGKGHAAFSSPMLTQTAQATGYQPDTGNVVSAGEIDGSVINGSTINGTTFNAGDIINNTNNTANYYPMTITPDGAYKSTYFDSRVALRASVRSGAIIYDYRSMLPDGNGKYIYSSTTIHGQGITIDSGHTDTKDSTFNGYRTGGSYISLTPSAGLLLHGSDANINFGGHLKDNEFDEGMYMNPYGNIIGKSASDYWQISKQGTDNTGGGPTARFGIDTGGKGTINFYRPLFVDEIGGFTDSNGNALFIHGNDDGKSGSTGQMLFRKDGRSAQIVSASIYNRTYSGGSNVTVTSYGTLGRITSASKYKLDITKETSISPANKLLSIDMSSWIDKSSAEQLSDSKTNGTDLSEPEMNVFRHYGLIAEDLIKAGLDEFVIKGDNGQAEGIEYDRLWTVLIPKIRQLSNDQIQNKMTIAKLGSEIEELKQGR